MREMYGEKNARTPARARLEAAMMPVTSIICAATSPPTERAPTCARGALSHPRTELEPILLRLTSSAVAKYSAVCASPEKRAASASRSYVAIASRTCSASFTRSARRTPSNWPSCRAPTMRAVCSEGRRPRNSRMARLRAKRVWAC